MNIEENIKSELLHVLKKKKLLGIKYIEQINFTNKINSKLKLPENLVQLNEYVENCSLCELSKMNIGINFGNGNIDSDLLIISLHNNFFDEKAFLNIQNMIENVLKIDLNDIYMTNILKCDIKVYKNNLDAEVSTCIPYLRKQIDLIKPTMIITFGKAFKYLLKTENAILDVSGNLFNYDGIDLIPLIDPKFIDKNPSYRDQMLLDLKKIKNIMDNK